MSSLRDDLNSRAYASADRIARRDDLDDGTVDVTGECVVCREDYVPVEDGYCAKCHWTEFETCEEWLDRVEARRATK